MRAHNALVLYLLSTLAAAQSPPTGGGETMYRWTDAKGIVHYGPHPPPGVDATPVKIRDTRIGGAPGTGTGNAGDAVGTQNALGASSGNTLATGKERYERPSGRYSRTFNDGPYADNCALARQSRELFQGRTATAWDVQLGRMRELTPEETTAQRERWDGEIARYCADQAD